MKYFRNTEVGKKLLQHCLMRFFVFCNWTSLNDSMIGLQPDGVDLNSDGVPQTWAWGGGGMGGIYPPRTSIPPAKTGWGGMAIFST
jgi:hypothetical protein